MCMLLKAQQLELDKGQWTDSKSGKEQVKAIYCCPAYLTSVQRTPWKKTKISMKLKLETKYLWQIWLTLVIPMTNTEMTEEI